MSDRTLCSEKELQETEQASPPARNMKRRNAIFMGQQEKERLLEEIAKGEIDIFEEATANEYS